MNTFRNISVPTALLLLGIIAFSFLHSELGWLGRDSDDHGGHDYCDLLKSAPRMQKVITHDVAQDRVPVQPFLTYALDRVSQTPSASQQGAASDQWSWGLYIRNRSMLI